MHFNDRNFVIPEGLTTDRFILRPIEVADAELDYAAVMESREYLPTWELSSWPEDDFTVAANLKDLEKLVDRRARRESFTYTVMNQGETHCLGCVYIVSTDAPTYGKARITSIGGRQWHDYDAAVYFWVRASELAIETDRLLLNELRRWLSQSWDLRGFLVLTSELFTQQVRLIENAGLVRRFEVLNAGKQHPYLAYE